MNTTILFTVLAVVLLACCAMPMLFKRKQGSRSNDRDAPWSGSASSDDKDG